MRKEKSCIFSDRDWFTMISLFSILFSRMSLVLKHKLPTKNKSIKILTKHVSPLNKGFSPETHTVGGLELLPLFYRALDKRRKIEKRNL
jgi:hypothetical protein